MTQQSYFQKDGANMHSEDKPSEGGASDSLLARYGWGDLASDADNGESKSRSLSSDESELSVEADRLDNAADSPEEIIRSDNRTVRFLRGLFALLLLLAATATVAFVYRYMSRHEKNQFVSEYESLSSTLLSSLFLDLRLNFWIAHTLSKTVTLAMLMKDEPVTNFTIPPRLWESVTQEARFVSEVLVVSWIPFLYSDEERAAFEENVRTSTEDSTYGNTTSYPACHVCDGNAGMVIEDEMVEVEVHGLSFKCGMVYWGGLNGGIPPVGCPVVQQAVGKSCSCIEREQTSNGALHGEAAFKRTEKDGLSTFLGEGSNYTLADQQNGQGPYAPMYTAVGSGLQRVPPLYDLFNDPIRGRALTNVMFNRNPAISEMRMRDSPYHEYTGTFIGEASADLYYPVLSDTFESSTELRVVGAIGFEFLWERLISGAVPAKSNLVSLVLENTCGQAHTYSIDPVESRLKLQDTTDKHNPKYTHMGRTSSYEDYEQIVRFEAMDGEKKMSDCLYRFRVYPTQSFENEYVTNRPGVFAAVGGVIFLFTSLVFVSYDTVIRRRQRKVMASAKRTNDIVSSLFPDTVRGRLYERAIACEGDEPVDRGSDFHVFAGRKEPSKGKGIFGSDPIADFFPHTTIMFLDIAGFTAWSSERDPEQVFSLLENIYHSFDEAGSKLGVFKVETIGDCYVAAAGLPKPRSDHAVGKSALHMPVTFFPSIFILSLRFSVRTPSNDSICTRMSKALGRTNQAVGNIAWPFDWRPSGSVRFAQRSSYRRCAPRRESAVPTIW
jgi:Adenylate and Guanylate cyclase catalytic domain